jgi:AMP nucleosidase
MNKRIEITKDSFANEKEIIEIVNSACDLMEQIYDEGDYPKLMVKRSWSEHNPIITGEMALPHAYRWYLSREMKKLLEKGAELKIFPSRPRVDMNDPALFDNSDEDEWDITQKKTLSI